MEAIKSILDGVLKDIQAKQRQLPEEGIDVLWAKCVEKKALKHTRIGFFKNGRLYVNVESPAWIYELNIQKEELLRRLQKVSKNKIKDIRFRVGDIKNGHQD